MTSEYLISEYLIGTSLDSELSWVVVLGDTATTWIKWSGPLPLPKSWLVRCAMDSTMTGDNRNQRRLRLQSGP